MLIAEIGLTIWAFNRGWKLWALLPLLIAFLIGLYLGSSGYNLSSAVFFFFDLSAIFALIMLIKFPPKEYIENKDNPDRNKRTMISCPKCGELTEIGKRKSWVLPVCIFLFPVGLLSLFADRESTKCKGCGNTWIT